MCFYARHATSSRRRPLRRRQTPSMPPLAMLDLSKPGERQAHDFLLRATSNRDRIWTLVTLSRLGDVLLCVVRWVHSASYAQNFALVVVSLIEPAVQWRYFASAKAARAEMKRRCASDRLHAESA